MFKTCSVPGLVKGIRNPIKLCRGCWIAAHAVVTQGVTIGAGSLIAANAVVTKDIPEGCAAGGIPAKIIRTKEGNR